MLRDSVARVKLDAEACYMDLLRDEPDLWAAHELLRSILAAASEADAMIARTLKLPEVQP